MNGWKGSQNVFDVRWIQSDFRSRLWNEKIDDVAKSRRMSRHCHWHLERWPQGWIYRMKRDPCTLFAYFYFSIYFSATRSLSVCDTSARPDKYTVFLKRKNLVICSRVSKYRALFNFPLSVHERACAKCVYKLPDFPRHNLRAKFKSVGTVSLIFVTRFL